MNQVEFGEYFKDHRIRSGYKSQRKLAVESGISNGTIARIEAGTQKVTAETLRTLSKYLTTWSYGEMLEKIGYFDGLSDEKKERMKESYSFRLQFTEQFRDLISKMSPGGVFSESVKKDIDESMEDYIDEGFTNSPEELVEIMYDKGDFSDMLDFYEKFAEIARKHNIIYISDEEREKKEKERQSKQMRDELSKKISELFIKCGITSRFDQDDYIESYVGDITTTTNMLRLIQLLEMETAKPELIDVDEYAKDDSLEILTLLQRENVRYRYRGRMLTPQDRQRILDMLKVLFPEQ